MRRTKPSAVLFRASVLVFLVAGLGVSGCSSRYYRLDADNEVYGILGAKSAKTQLTVPSLSIDPPPQSRNHDSTFVDRPPHPPDDPAAHRYMHCVDGMPGYHGWHKSGDATWIEDPSWKEFLQLSEDGSLDLDRSRAAQLGLLHSRQYQSQLENLYLAALALTLERFEFDLKWFGRSTTEYEHFGKGSTPDESNELKTASNLGFNRALSTGGQLLVDFANTLVWEFTGSNSHVAFSDLTVRLVQPLLRGAARDVRLESLTQSERNVLYSVRDFARFRKQFYFDIVSGNQGYLSLLLQLQGIRNLESNLDSLELNLRAHEALSSAGIVSPIQVDQVFQSYQSGRLRLIRARNDLEAALDAFKLRLGLPPQMEIRLDDSLLSPFQLNDPEVTELERDVERIRADFRGLDEPPPAEVLRKGFDDLQRLHQRVAVQFDLVHQEFESWMARSDESATTDSLSEERRLDAQETLRERLDELRTGVEETGREIGLAAEATVSDQQLQEAWAAIEKLSRDESTHISDIFVIQTQIRTYLIQIQPTDYESDDTVALAVTNRLDLMNRRAMVVDAWRKIRVVADGLESDLDVFMEADIATEPGSRNPVKFSSQASRYRAGVTFDGPLNRLAERNAYRAELINYQKARRGFIAARDAIVQNVRSDLRELKAEKLNFEITRQRLITAARQVELARLQLLAPGQAGDSSTTRDALDALNSLLEANNALISTWVTYETVRLQLLLDTEVLQLDERGIQASDDLESGPAPDTVNISFGPGPNDLGHP